MWKCHVQWYRISALDQNYCYIVFTIIKCKEIWNIGYLLLPTVWDMHALMIGGTTEHVGLRQLYLTKQHFKMLSLHVQYHKDHLYNLSIFMAQEVSL